ncbi:hypothetical protein NMG60_11014841 [Bertholletia excelsa]
MSPDSQVTFKDQEERQSPFLEIINSEKQLWALIHSKGLLHREVRDLYHKARSGYENIILDDHEEVELQDVEYSLWKLHYKHIDEFRKVIRQASASAGSTKSPTPQNVADVQSIIDDHIEQFKSFLLEATEFYHDLIKKVRRSYGQSEDPLFYENSVLCAVDTNKFYKCQYSCHRFLVCLGDLARYRELFKKPNFQKCNWSIAATYYFKAKLVWPDSGNPQNQLALLATYIGDEFLALYHCIRSLAIKEPFPDASDNLILLFEKNRSSHLNSLSKKLQFNFLNPSARITSNTGLPSHSGSMNNDVPQTSENIHCTRSELWPLFVRMISFFFIEFSLDDFNCTLASALKELDSLLELDDMKLKSSLESYQLMDSGRTGPYRAIQMVSILIFIIDSLTKSLELQNSKEKEKSIVQQPTVIQLALISSFIFLGRLLERCVKGNSPELSPLLPSGLIFVEWLVGFLATVEIYTAHEEVRCATLYFFGALADLVNQICKNEAEVKAQDCIALWEDHELRGFTPIAHAHDLLNFTTDLEPMGNVDCRNLSRISRIFHSATQIVDRSDDHQKWIFYDKLGRKFYLEETGRFSDQTEAEAVQSVSDPVSQPPDNGKFVLEEEEEIVFKPIMRYNSAPLSTFLENDDMSVEGMRDQKDQSAECLRRATSLHVGQSQAQIDPLSLYTNTGNLRNSRPFKPQEPLLKDPTLYPAGPPSLNAWVLNRESSSIEKEKGTRDYKSGLDPIAEIASSPSLAGLSIYETRDSGIGSGLGSGHIPVTIPYPPPPPYTGPVPSAPLLPDDAIGFTANCSSFPDYQNLKNAKETDGILGASPAAHGPLGYGPSIPGAIEGYQPMIGMSSSEWLHHYTNQTLERANSQAWPVHFYNPGSLGTFYGPDMRTFDLCDRWGNPLGSNQMVYLEGPQLYPGPLVYDSDEQRREKLLHGYQRLSPYGCGAVTDLRAEQPPLLQYLKEKEWQFQRQSQVRGPTYMGN